jgi:hypothetical protein
VMRRAIVIPVALIVGWWAISMSRSLSGVEGSGPQVPEVPVARKLASVPLTEAQAGTVKAVKKDSSEAAPAKTVAKEPPYRPFPFVKELTSYLDLKAKVFMTDDERRERARLLNHQEFMRALAERLMDPSRSPLLMQEQDAAVDLLVEAVQTGDKGLATELLNRVVQDAQVENESLETSVREHLAGLKAEVLYQWSAVSPEAAATVPGLLPGPVSQKIWANVVHRQHSNQLED